MKCCFLTASVLLIALADCRSEAPAEDRVAVAVWNFEGNLRDSSGHGHHLSGKQIEFVPVQGGQALKSGARAVQVASNPALPCPGPAHRLFRVL